MAQAAGSPVTGTNYSGDGLCARTNATGGIDLYFTTGSGGIAGNSLVTVHDSGNLTTLTLGAVTTNYTAAANSTLKGVTFAPVPPVFNLGTTNLVVGPATGINSVVLGTTPVTALNSWTASTNATWLHLSAANQGGYGGTNVIFTFDANAGATRSGTLTIAGQTFTIIQAGSTYVAANPLTTNLVSSGLNSPRGAAVDGAGNVYIADVNNHAVKKWTATNNTVTTLVNATQVPGIVPEGVAVDGAGNVYIADQGNGAIEEWSEAPGHAVTTLVNQTQIPNLIPFGVAVDAAGNVSIADLGNSAFERWSVANQTLTTLAYSSAPYGVAVDGAGNVYMSDAQNDLVEEWSVANNTVSVLVGITQVPGIQPWGVAVDGSGMLYRRLWQQCD